MILSCLVATAATGFCVVGPDAEGQTKLTYVEGPLAGAELGLGSGGYGWVDPSGRPPKGLAYPREVHGPLFFTLSIGNTGKMMVGMLAKSKDKLPASDRMWVDWNGDQKLSPNEEAVKASSDRGEVVFKPQAGSTSLKLALRVYADRTLTVEPSGRVEGVVTWGGKRIKVAICDSNLNGIFGDRYGSMSGGDLLLLDRNGNGKFDVPTSLSAASMYNGEFAPIMATMQFSPGEYASVTVAKDGSALAITRDTSPKGTLRLVGGVATAMLLESQKGPIFGQPKDGKVVVPAGAYTLQMMEYQVRDQAGKTWTFSVGGYDGPKLTVSAGKTVDVAVGPPLKVGLKVEPMEGQQYFTLELKDRGGRALSSLADSKGNRPAPPALVISDARGRKVKSMPFEYG